MRGREIQVGEAPERPFVMRAQMVPRVEENYSDDFGILVHSCTVEDGQGEKRVIIDENGCHTDRHLLGDPTYAESLNIAYREAYVFKFADRTALRFKCGIRLCLKHDGGCDGVTPPLCINETHFRDSGVEGSTGAKEGNNAPEMAQYSRWRHRRTARSFAEKDVDLLSQRIVVLDSVGEEPTQLNQERTIRTTVVCLGLKTTAWTTAFIVTCLLLSLTLALAQSQRKGYRTLRFVFWSLLTGNYSCSIITRKKSQL
ncbi:hypothetical protein ANCDUO_16190 [Ancylostoma duodenale]|uniref:ZP domain-containing protein n=1 Tax=Ancylostoma duodenale TaxID=51022 RepID=A0A0C2CV10_9BILA|nr:hypothetical protein ANCDUO_16190 [Ancylostoma duodenale]